MGLLEQIQSHTGSSYFWPVVCLVLWISYGLISFTYRLFFSPIAHFPGPKLAAMTFWYEFYYDVILPGQYTFHIMELHKKYGPVVRINPRELHFYTPSFYEEIYAGPQRRRNRWDYYTRGFGMPTAGGSTSDHDLHRARRAALSPYFSMQSVRRLQTVIEEKANLLMGRFKGFGEAQITEGKKKPINLEIAFSAYSYDVVVEYAFARSEHHLEAEDFDPWMPEAAVATGSLSQIAKNVYWFFWLIFNMPDWIAKRLDQHASRWVQFKGDIRKQIDNIRHGYNTSHKTADHTTIFHDILNSPLPESEKRTSRLADEGTTLVAAGTVTTAWTLAVATYYLLRQPAQLRKLKEELYGAIENPNISTPLPDLERLPYLTAVIQETLRLSHGICSRLERIAPDEDLQFHDGSKLWVVPRGTPVSMTTYMLHNHPETFPSPEMFRPERWIENPRLDRQLVAFSKGKMQCLGINLAYAELYLMLAKMFRVYGSREVQFDGDVGIFDLFDTSEKDVLMAEDRFIPRPFKGSRGIRVSVELS